MQDFEVTYRLENASKILGIQLLDHIVIGKSEYTSIMSIKDWKLKLNNINVQTNYEKMELKAGGKKLDIVYQTSNFIVYINYNDKK